MKKTLLLLFVLHFQFTFSQQIVNSIDDGFSKLLSIQPRSSYTIVNKETNEILFFFQERKNITIKLYDKNFEHLNTLKSEDFFNSEEDWFTKKGFSIDNRRYNIYGTGKDGYLSVISIDFEKGKISKKQLNLFSELGTFLHSINYNNQLHFLSVDRNSKSLNIYKFDENSKFTKKTIFKFNTDFKPKANEDFLTSFFGRGKLNISEYDAISLMEHIEKNNPSTIEKTSAIAKSYLIENKLFITFDQLNTSTKIYSVNLDTFEIEVIDILKPRIEGEQITSNSFILNNQIFQIIASEKELKLSIEDIQSKKHLKEFGYNNSANTFEFKNSPFYHEKIALDGQKKRGVREHENTILFLNKLAKRDAGISVYKTGKTYQITLGGVKKVFIITKGIFDKEMESIVDMRLENNSFFNQYQNHADAKFHPTHGTYRYPISNTSNYVKCSLDENFEHVKGPYEESTFDKAKRYFLKNKKKLAAKNLFHHNDTIYFGHFSSKKRNYQIVKFE